MGARVSYDFRCSGCHTLLGKIKYSVAAILIAVEFEVKCRKCKMLRIFDYSKLTEQEKTVMLRQEKPAEAI